MDAYKLEERKFMNFEGQLLNEEFLEFNSIWENNLIQKLREYCGLPTRKHFKTVDIFTRDDCVDDYEDLI